MNDKGDCMKDNVVKLKTKKELALEAVDLFSCGECENHLFEKKHVLVKNLCTKKKKFHLMDVYVCGCCGKRYMDGEIF